MLGTIDCQALKPGLPLIIRDGQDQLGGKLFLSSRLQKQFISSFNSWGKLAFFLYSVPNVHKTSISLTNPFVGKDKGQKVSPRIPTQAMLPLFSCCVFIFCPWESFVLPETVYAISLLPPRSFQTEGTESWLGHAPQELLRKVCGSLYPPSLLLQITQTPDPFSDTEF